MEEVCKPDWVGAVVTILMFGLACIVCYFWGSGKNKRLIGTLEDAVEHYRRTYKDKVGGTLMPDGRVINYNLKSVDRGVTWLAFDKDGSFLGEVEKVYPGLMKQLRAWENIEGLIANNIETNPQAMRNLLAEAGFVPVADESILTVGSKEPTPELKKGEAIFRKDGSPIGIII